MSVLAGIFYYDRRPVGDALVRRVDDLLRRYQADACGMHVEPGLLMACRAVHVTPEDEHVSQPIVVSQSGNVLAWDGRLDNRDDLIRACGLRNASVPDAELVLAAYEKDAQNACASFIGDWSLAVWHRGERKLVLASDYMGVRPLCYFNDSDRVVWSTSAEFLRDLRGRDEVDDEFIIAHLTYCCRPDHTPYAGILKVTAAHDITFTAAKAPVKRQFWDFPSETLHYRCARDYEEQMKHLMLEAVSVRVRSRRPVWSELSGGLDSSSVVCLADHVLRKKEAGSNALVTVSHFSSTSRESDERRFMTAVQDQVQRPAMLLDLDECLVESLSSIGPTWPGMNVGATRQELNLMKIAGARVILSGRMGDTVMRNVAEDSAHLADLLAHGSLVRLIRDARRWALATRKPISHVLWDALATMFPLSWQVAISNRAFLAQHTRGTRLHVDDAREFLSLKGPVADVMRASHRAYLQSAIAHPALGKRWLLASLYRYSIGRMLESRTYGWQSAFTYPYSHRPLVAFMLSIPAEVAAAPGQPRRLMKAALTGLVPSRILQRFSKSAGSGFKLRVLAPLVGRLLDASTTLQVVERGYVEPDSLRRRCLGIVNGSCVHMGNMLAIVVVEQWLRAHSATLQIRRADS